MPPVACPSSCAPGADGAQVQLKFAWAKEWLGSRLVGLGCEDEDGVLVCVDALRAFSGEARVSTQTTGRARGRTVRSFDLSLSLGWVARVGGERCSGGLSVNELASHAELAEAEIRISYDAGHPPSGDGAELALVGLIGPLRCESAAAAEGRLTQQVWRTLAEFREAFDGL